MGGCRRTSAPFSLSRDLPPDSLVIAAVNSFNPTAIITVNQPMTDPAPPDTHLDFAIFFGAAERPGVALTVLTPTTFRIQSAPFLGVITRIRYIQAQPPWPTLAGGRLLDFDVPVPFP